MCGSPLIRIARASFVTGIFFSFLLLTHSPLLEQERPGEKSTKKMNTVTNRKGRYGSPGGGWGVAPLQAEQQRRAECATSDNDDPVIVTKHVDTRGEGRAAGGQGLVRLF